MTERDHAAMVNAQYNVAMEFGMWRCEGSGRPALSVLQLAKSLLWTHRHGTGWRF
jgi:hypothetical protein